MTSASTTAGLAALLGAGTGLGLMLIISGRTRVRPKPVKKRGTLAIGRRQVPRLGLAVLAAMTTGLLTGWFVGAVLAGLASWTLPRLLGGDPEHAHRVARVEAIASWTEMLRDTLSASAGLEQAILATAPLAPQPIRSAVGELMADIENGQRLAPALRRLGERLDDPVGDLIIAALLLATEQHTRQLADLLGSLADAARAQASMRLRVEAGRARTRTSVRMIVGTTVVFAVAVVVFNRDYVSAYDSAHGQIMLLGIGGLFTLGFAWLARIARLSGPERILTTANQTLPAPPRMAIVPGSPG